MANSKDLESLRQLFRFLDPKDPRVTEAGEALDRIQKASQEVAVLIRYPKQTVKMENGKAIDSFELARRIGNSLQRGESIRLPEESGWTIQQIPRPTYVLLEQQD